ncbi:MAG: DUF134 domain-containing protein [Candidatus Cloacimonas sp.]|jgi:predicted DNA-binding protein (UPF0251 family)|nr:DUF134 domain-containing protein [Candidatus Cloacimonas sp.]
MPRLKILRSLDDLPIIKGFRPIWMKANLRQAVIMNLEEYEALRLIDYENQIHEQAAGTMNISRPTFTRIYEAARKKLATALVEGRSLLIEGGNVSVQEAHWYCESCFNKFSTPIAPETGETQCPKCNSKSLISLNDCFINGCRRCRRCR